MIRAHLNWFWLLVMVTPIAMYFLVKYRYSSALVFEALVMTIVAYLGMALLHHYAHKNLTLEIGLEYVLTAALAIIILQSLLIQ